MIEMTNSENNFNSVEELADCELTIFSNNKKRLSSPLSTLKY
jgi:hypothetical protein